jgi:hypothetical protein
MRSATYMHPGGLTLRSPCMLYPVKPCCVYSIMVHVPLEQSQVGHSRVVSHIKIDVDAPRVSLVRTLTLLRWRADRSTNCGLGADGRARAAGPAPRRGPARRAVAGTGYIDIRSRPSRLCRGGADCPGPAPGAAVRSGAVPGSRGGSLLSRGRASRFRSASAFRTSGWAAARGPGWYCDRDCDYCVCRGAVRGAG